MRHTMGLSETARWSATTLPRTSGYRPGTGTQKKGLKEAKTSRPRGSASEELQRLAGGLSAQSRPAEASFKESALRPPVPGEEFAWLAAIGMSSAWTLHRPKVRDSSRRR